MHLQEALKQVGLEEALLDALTAQLLGAMNEAALWIAQQDNDQHARDQAHRALEMLLASVLP